MEYLRTNSDICFTSFGEAEDIMYEKWGTEPVKLVVSSIDSEYCKDKDFDGASVIVDPLLDDNAWYIEDEDGNQVGSAG